MEEIFVSLGYVGVKREFTVIIYVNFAFILSRVCRRNALVIVINF